LLVGSIFFCNGGSHDFIKLFVEEFCFHLDYLTNTSQELKVIKYFFEHIEKTSTDEYEDKEIINLLFFLNKNEVCNFIDKLNTIYSIFLDLLVKYDPDNNNINNNTREKIPSIVFNTFVECLDTHEKDYSRVYLSLIAQDFRSLVQFLEDQKNWFYDENFWKVHRSYRLPKI